MSRTQIESNSSRVCNAFTVDVEDYFQVGAFAEVIKPEEWSRWPCRIEASMDKLLSLLDEYGVTATFFTLGWIAQHYPRLVRQIVDNGHELASHGYAHQRVYQQTPDQFRHDVESSKQILEQLSGMAVTGYRAPSFSISSETPWAFEILAAAGYGYSSSTYPIRHDHYGVKDDPKQPYYPVEGLLEIPISTVESFLGPLPAGGGGYFRLLPYPVSRWLLDRFAAHNGSPGIFYMHPWELDPNQPRIPGIPLRSRFRHYLNLAKVEGRLRRLLGDFSWDRMDRLYLSNPPELCGHKSNVVPLSMAP